MKLFVKFVPYIFFVFITILIFKPVFDGLILLPLDLLITKYAPWGEAATILVKNPYMQDSILQMYPWKVYGIHEILKGNLPLWNPYQMLGMPFAASLKPMIYYPFNILFLLGDINGWNLFLATQILLTLIFTFILGRSLYLSRLISVILSLSFSLNSLTIGLLQFGSEGHLIMWLPLLLFAQVNYLKRGKTYYLILTILTSLLCILGGQLQYSFYAFFIYFAILIVQLIYRKIIFKYFYNLLFAVFLGAVISAIQLIPTFEMYFLSSRNLAHTANIFTADMISPIHLLRLISPDLFGNPTSGEITISYIESSGYFGIIPLVFSIYFLFSKTKSHFGKSIKLLVIFGLILSQKYIGNILSYLQIPLITFGSGARLFFIALISLILSSALGLQHFINNFHIKREKFKLFIIFILLILLYLAAYKILRYDSISNFLKNTKYQLLGLWLFFILYILYLKFTKYLSKQLFLFLLIILTAFDLFRLTYRFITFSNTKFLYPENKIINTVNDIISDEKTFVQGLTEPEVNTFLKSYSLETYNPLYPYKTGLLLNAVASKNFDLPVNKYYLEKLESEKKLVDFFGVKQIVTPRFENPSIYWFNTTKFEKDFQNIYVSDRYEIYENKTANSPWALYFDTEKIENSNEELDLIRSGKINIYSTVTTNKNIEVDKGASGLIKNVYTSSSKMTFEIDSTGNGLFVLKQSNYPGWTAYINNKETEIINVFYNLQGIKISKGFTKIEIKYKPTSFLNGLIVSLFGIMAAIIFIIYSKYYKNNTV